jgi:hypothetical protein
MFSNPDEVNMMRSSAETAHGAWLKGIAVSCGALSLNLSIGYTASALESISTIVSETAEPESAENRADAKEIVNTPVTVNPPCMNASECGTPVQFAPNASNNSVPPESMVTATAEPVFESTIEPENIPITQSETIGKTDKTTSTIVTTEQTQPEEDGATPSSVLGSVQPGEIELAVAPQEIALTALPEVEQNDGNAHAEAPAPQIQPEGDFIAQSSLAATTPLPIIDRPALPTSPSPTISALRNSLPETTTELSQPSFTRNTSVAQSLTSTELDELTLASEQLSAATASFKQSLTPGSFACVHNSDPRCGNPPLSSSPWSRLPTNFRTEYEAVIARGSTVELEPLRQQLNNALQEHYASLTPGSFACINNSDPRCGNPILFSSPWSRLPANFRTEYEAVIARESVAELEPLRQQLNNALQEHYASLTPGSFACINNSDPACGNPPLFSSPWAQFEPSFQARYYELIRRSSRTTPTRLR